MQIAAIIVSILGGLFELGGLAAVMLEIKSDRDQARALLSKDRQHQAPLRRYPPDLPVRGTTVTPGERRRFGHSPDVYQLRAEVERSVAALANHLTDQRRALDKERDELEVKLFKEIDAGDEELREGFREILAGDLRIRTAGVSALLVGILLSATGSVLGSLS